MLRCGPARALAGGVERRRFAARSRALAQPPARRAAHVAPPPTGDGSNTHCGGEEKMKINKAMVQRGICSRREANEYIKRGLVLVDGQPAFLGQVVGALQEVALVPAAAAEQGRKVSIMLHKPAGWVSQNSDAEGADRQRLAIKLLTWQNQTRFCRGRAEPGGEAQGEPCRLRGLAVAGRLDADSRGLLIFTQVAPPAVTAAAAARVAYGTSTSEARVCARRKPAAGTRGRMLTPVLPRRAPRPSAPRRLRPALRLAGRQSSPGPRVPRWQGRDGEGVLCHCASLESQAKHPRQPQRPPRVEQSKRHYSKRHYSSVPCHRTVSAGIFWPPVAA